MTIEPDVARWNHGGPPDPIADPRLMHVIAECWPLAADRKGIWLLTRDWPLMTEPLATSSDVYGDLRDELARAQMIDRLEVLHQTSCKLDRGAVVLNHVAVIRSEGPVPLLWPDALPLSPDMYRHPKVGNPPTHGAADLPKVRQLDVVTNGLRAVTIEVDGMPGMASLDVGHLTFQLGPVGDAELAAALDRASPEGWWGEHLARWAPVLYQMYSDPHVPERA